MDDSQRLRPIDTQVTVPLDGEGDRTITYIVTDHLPLRALPHHIQAVGRVQGDRAEILTAVQITSPAPSWPPAIETKDAGPVPVSPIAAVPADTQPPTVPTPRRRKETS